MGRPPKSEEEDGRAATPGQSKNNHSGRYLHDNFGFGNSDRWLERYLRWLQLENERLSGGEIGRGFWKFALASYSEFRVSSCPRARWRTWMGIQALCEWLSKSEAAYE